LHLDSKTDDETGEKVVVAMRFNLKRSTFPYSNTIGPEVEWPAKLVIHAGAQYRVDVNCCDDHLTNRQPDLMTEPR
jgi:hypothetical protein